MFQSLDLLNKNTDSQATRAQSIEHAFAAPTVPCSSLSHSLLLGQNRRSCVSCEGIGKKIKPVIALACPNVKHIYNLYKTDGMHLKETFQWLTDQNL